MSTDENCNCDQALELQTLVQRAKILFAGVGYIAGTLLASDIETWVSDVDKSEACRTPRESLRALAKRVLQKSHFDDPAWTDADELAKRVLEEFGGE